MHGTGGALAAAPGRRPAAAGDPRARDLGTLRHSFPGALPKGPSAKMASGKTNLVGC